MRRARVTLAGLVGALVCTLLVSVGLAGSSSGAGSIRTLPAVILSGDGSTFQLPYTQAVLERVQAATTAGHGELRGRRVGTRPRRLREPTCRLRRCRHDVHTRIVGGSQRRPVLLLPDGGRADQPGLQRARGQRPSPLRKHDRRDLRGRDHDMGFGHDRGGEPEPFVAEHSDRRCASRRWLGDDPELHPSSSPRLFPVRGHSEPVQR